MENNGSYQKLSVCPQSQLDSLSLNILSIYIYIHIWVNTCEFVMLVEYRIEAKTKVGFSTKKLVHRKLQRFWRRPFMRFSIYLIPKSPHQSTWTDMFYGMDARTRSVKRIWNFGFKLWRKQPIEELLRHLCLVWWWFQKLFSVLN